MSKQQKIAKFKTEFRQLVQSEMEKFIKRVEDTSGWDGWNGYGTTEKALQDFAFELTSIPSVQRRIGK